MQDFLLEDEEDKMIFFVQPLGLQFWMDWSLPKGYN